MKDFTFDSAVLIFHDHDLSDHGKHIAHLAPKFAHP